MSQTLTELLEEANFGGYPIFDDPQILEILRKAKKWLITQQKEITHTDKDDAHDTVVKTHTIYAYQTLINKLEKEEENQHQ